MRTALVLTLRAEIRHSIDPNLLSLPDAATTRLPGLASHTRVPLAAHHSHPRGLLRHSVGHAFVHVHDLVVRDTGQVLPTTLVRHHKRDVRAQAVVSTTRHIEHAHQQQYRLLSVLSEATAHSVHVRACQRLFSSCHRAVSHQLDRATYMCACQYYRIENWLARRLLCHFSSLVEGLKALMKYRQK